MKSIILAYDIGTSSVKTSLIDSMGNVLDTAMKEYPTQYAAGGIAEQDPQDWWGCVCATTNELVDKHPEYKSGISVIGVSGHMLGCLPVDSSGNALGNSLLHSDSRASAQYLHIGDAVGADELYRMTGNVLDARSTLCKILWMKENEPSIYANTAKFLQSKDFVVSKLTGNFTTDYSDACHGELMNITTKKYEPELFEELGLDINKLPELHKGSDIVGCVTKKSAEMLGISSGVPVIAGGGDGACGNIGAANIEVGNTYISLGSTAWIAQCLDKPYFDPKKRLFNIANLDGGSCTLYGTMQSACSSVSWAMRLLGMDDVKKFDEMAAEAVPGCGGLMFLPYLDGERTPVFDSHARGTLIGLSLSHRREEFARSIMEGVAYALAEILGIFREQSHIDAMRIIGGGAKSGLWKQIISDICESKIESLSVSASDATSIGIAAAAGTAVGLFPNIRDAVSFIRIKFVNTPGEKNPAYRRNFGVYKKMYGSTKELMSLLSD